MESIRNIMEREGLVKKEIKVEPVVELKDKAKYVTLLGKKYQTYYENSDDIKVKLLKMELQSFLGLERKLILNIKH